MMMYRINGSLLVVVHMYVSVCVLFVVCSGVAKQSGSRETTGYVCQERCVGHLPTEVGLPSLYSLVSIFSSFFPSFLSFGYFSSLSSHVYT